MTRFSRILAMLLSLTLLGGLCAASADENGAITFPYTGEPVVLRGLWCNHNNRIEDTVAYKDDAKAWRVELFHAHIDALGALYQGNPRLSIERVKYVYALLLSDLAPLTNEDLTTYVRDIYNCQSINELGDIVKLVADKLMTYEGEVPAERNWIVTRVMRIVERDYTKNPSTDEIAGELNMSPGYLTALFRRYQGLTVTKYVAQYRLEKARELLAGGNMKVHAVCQMLGFTDVSYFIVQFKAAYGITPGSYLLQVHGDA